VTKWLAYALSTNERGEALASAVERFLDRSDWSGARVLDVGCAYGGVLRAFARRGAQVLGIDSNERLLSLATANLADAPESRHRLEHVRLEDLDASHIGQFELIVCDNVLEHVVDPSAAVERLSSLLAVGGELYVAVPNPFAPEQVRSDPHFAIAGITLLERDLAERFFRALGMQGEYTVGHYSTCEQYFTWLAAAGLDARYATRTTFFGEPFRSEIADVEKTAAAVAEASTDSTRRLSESTLPEDLRRAVGAAILDYRECFRRDRVRTVDQPGRALLMEWYGPQVWHFCSVRGGRRRPGSRPRTLRS
jgi:2-polyprenyl-3-methyl-5-hydroxy-6-metoxy-1,4-benzoquinol methylase